MGSASAWAPVSEPNSSGWTPIEENPAGFVSSLAQRANPLNVIKGVASAVAHPLDTLKSWRDQSQDLHDAAVDAAQRGDYREALDHALGFVANLIPGLGKPADDFLTAARSGSDDEFKSKAGEFLGQALATAEAQGAAKAVGKIPGAARAVAKEVQKPGTLQAVGGAAQVAAGIGAITHEPIAGVYALGRGVRDISVGMDKRAEAAAAAAIPPVWDDIAQGTAGKKYLELNEEEKTKVQDLAAKMNAPQAEPIRLVPRVTPNPPSGDVPGTTTSPPVASSNPRGAPAPLDSGTLGMAVSSMSPGVGPSSPAPVIAFPASNAKPISPELEVSASGRSGSSGSRASGVSPESGTPAPAQPKTDVSRTASQEQSTTAPTSDPNVVWDPERGHVDVRTGKAPVKAPDVVVLGKQQAQEIVDKLADPSRFYGRTSLRPNSEAQIQRNADALKAAAAKKVKLGDLMQ